MTTKNQSEKIEERRAGLRLAVAAAAFAVYFFSNPKPQYYYDYTFRVAENFLRGAVGFVDKPPRHLNEFVPFENLWYSVFPLGSVLTMIPFAFFKLIGAIREMPAAYICALTAAIISIFLAAIAERYDKTIGKRLVLIAGILFGTWLWTNEAMAGAWQLALGFAMIGELGAIYFTVYERKPILAGLFFALAFGNRTEILLTAPIFMYLTARTPPPESGAQDSKNEPESLPGRSPLLDLAAFCAAPFLLGTATLGYNYLRFHSPTDFGYARIPGVLNEPWYNHGIFSLYYIPGQAYEMLFRLWERRAAFPYLTPNGFSSSILWSSPFLLFAFRPGARDKTLKYAAWTAIVVLTFLLWIHGNSGGWQFGYRYAVVLLPWLFVILLETGKRKLTVAEICAYTFSILINLYATYLFLWTDYIKP